MAGVFNALVTQGHVSINRLLSTTRSYLQSATGARATNLRRTGRRIRLARRARPPGKSRRGAGRWLYAHAGGLIEVRVTAPTTRHAIELQIAVLDGPPLRFLLSNHVALNGDDGTEAVPIRYKRDAKGIVMRPIPDTDVGRRFPKACFGSIRRPAPPWNRSAMTRCCSADGCSRRQPYLTVLTAPATRVGFRLTGGLVAAPATGPASVDEEAAATRFWTAMAGPVALSAPAASPFVNDVAGLQDISRGTPTMR